jgi:hypothetical protein
MATEAELQSLARSILAEKRARKAAEDDALRLYNRVRQLEKEEDKAQKRIVETKKKVCAFGHCSCTLGRCHGPQQLYLHVSAITHLCLPPCAGKRDHQAPRAE